MAGNGNTYATKLDEAMKKSTSAWFDGLTKVELLQFLQDRPDISADDLRGMLRRENVTLGFGVQFTVSDGNAVADFGASE